MVSKFKLNRHKYSRSLQQQLQSSMISKAMERYFKFSDEEHDNDEKESSRKRNYLQKGQQHQNCEEESNLSNEIIQTYQDFDEENQQQSEVSSQSPAFKEQLQSIKEKLNQRYSLAIKSHSNLSSASSQKYLESSLTKQSPKSSSSSYLFQKNEVRQVERQILALAIINKKQFNAASVREQFQKSKPGYFMNRDKVRTLSRSVCVDFVRTLEKIITQQCKIKFQALSNESVKALTKIIPKCKQALDPSLCQTTLTFLKYIYDLDTVQLETDALIKLYKRLRSLAKELLQISYQTALLKQKPGELSPIHLFELQKIKRFTRGEENVMNLQTAHLNKLWEQKHQIYLRKIYKQTQSFAKIREKFREIFPSINPFCTIKTLDLRLKRIVRKGLKKLKAISQSEEYATFSHLIQLNDYLIKIICARLPFRQIRLQLIELLENKLDKRSIINLINRINLQCQTWMQKREPTYSIQEKNSIDYQFDQEQQDQQVSIPSHKAKKSGKK